VRIAVLGLGNLLLTDEGAGVHAIRALRQEGLPNDVELVDVGTAVLDAIPAMEAADRIIAIDAVCAGKSPGTIYRMRLDEFSPNPVIGSMHGFDISRVLALCDDTDLAEIVVIGIEPECFGWSMELSPTVAAAMPNLIEAVRYELETMSTTEGHHWRMTG